MENLLLVDIVFNIINLLIDSVFDFVIINGVLGLFFIYPIKVCIYIMQREININKAIT